MQILCRLERWPKRSRLYSYLIPLCILRPLSLAAACAMAMHAGARPANHDGRHDASGREAGAVSAGCYSRSIDVGARTLPKAGECRRRRRCQERETSRSHTLPRETIGRRYGVMLSPTGTDTPDPPCREMRIVGAQGRLSCRWIVRRGSRVYALCCHPVPPPRGASVPPVACPGYDRIAISVAPSTRSA